MRIFRALFMASTLISGPCLAHVDHVITVESDGTLVGIPAEYGPAALHVQFSQSKIGAPITFIDLSLGKNHIHLPICVTGLLETRSKSEIKASASWYHNESYLPYYLHIDFFDPGYDSSRWANPGYSLLFNLHTGKLIKMKVHIVRDNGRGIQDVPVDLADPCKPEELKGFANAIPS